jgi:hypothetical protein
MILSRWQEESTSKVPLILTILLGEKIEIDPRCKFWVPENHDFNLILFKVWNPFLMEFPRISLVAILSVKILLNPCILLPIHTVSVCLKDQWRMQIRIWTIKRASIKQFDVFTASLSHIKDETNACHSKSSLKFDISLISGNSSRKRECFSSPLLAPKKKSRLTFLLIWN